MIFANMLPVMNHNDKEWNYEQHKAARPIDFEIAALKDWRIAIQNFEGVEQPVAYSGELVFALPHYQTDANDAIVLFCELPSGVIYPPRQTLSGRWGVLFAFKGEDQDGYLTKTSEFGDSLNEAVCKAWLAWFKNEMWINQLGVNNDEQ